MENKRIINIVISDFVLNKLNLYVKYVGISRSACIAYFLSKQIRSFKYDKNNFFEKWNLRRFKSMATDSKYDGASEHSNRFAIAVSEELYDDLIWMKMKEQLDVSLPKLTTNMIIMELNDIFGDMEKDFSHRRNQIEKQELRHKIQISNIFLMRLDTISEKIGIPRHALISQAIAEYLINNYTEYDNNFYMDSEGNNYHGVW